MRLPLLFFAGIFCLLSCANNNSQSDTTAPQETIISSPSSTSPSYKEEATTALTNSKACLLSEIAYCIDPQRKIDHYLPGWKVVWHPASVNGNHAFVATDGKQYAIAIRGSLIEFSWDAFDNWIYQDMNVAIQKNWPYCSNKDAKISQGAYRGWENLTKMKDSITGKTLLSFLQETTTGSTPVIFTGHSLGGNLATVFASYFSFKQKEAGKPNNNINVITFAAPAAGNTDFANSFNKQFPQSVRIEGKGDIVPKFPCTDKVAALGALYSASLSANKIMVGYKNMTVPLSTVFKTISTAMSLLELKNGLSSFAQTNGEGKIIDIPLSGKNNSNDIAQWFAEAGYQHSVEQYAKAMGAPVIDFTNN
jgi:hypothetical protein